MGKSLRKKKIFIWRPASFSRLIKCILKSFSVCLRYASLFCKLFCAILYLIYLKNKLALWVALSWRQHFHSVNIESFTLKSITVKISFSSSQLCFLSLTTWTLMWAESLCKTTIRKSWAIPVTPVASHPLLDWALFQLTQSCSWATQIYCPVKGLAVTQS